MCLLDEYVKKQKEFNQFEFNSEKRKIIEKRKEERGMQIFNLFIVGGIFLIVLINFILFKVSGSEASLFDFFFTVEYLPKTEFWFFFSVILNIVLSMLFVFGLIKFCDYFDKKDGKDFDETPSFSFYAFIFFSFYIINILAFLSCVFSFIMFCLTLKNQMKIRKIDKEIEVKNFVTEKEFIQTQMRLNELKNLILKDKNSLTGLKELQYERTEENYILQKLKSDIVKAKKEAMTDNDILEFSTNTIKVTNEMIND